MIFSLDELDEDLVKGGAGFVHVYYSHLRKKPPSEKWHKQASHTLKVMRTRKDGVVQSYWVSPDAKDRKYFVHSEFSDIDHDHDAHFQKLKDEEGLDKDKGDVFKLSTGDTVKIGAEGGFHGREGVVIRQSHATKASPTMRVSVSFPIEGKPGKFKVGRFGIGDLEKVKEGNPTDILKEGKNGEAPQPKLAKEKKKIDAVEETAKERHDRLRKKIELHGIYRGAKGQKRFRVAALSKDLSKVKLEPVGFPEPVGLVVQAEALQKHLNDGSYVREFPSVSDTVNKETQPFTYALESGTMHEDGLIYFDENGSAKATPEGKTFLGEVVGEHLGKLVDAAYNKAAALNDKYPGTFSKLTHDDVEDIVSKAYESLVDRLAKYEPFLGNMVGGVRTFLSQKINSKAEKMAKAEFYRKNATQSLDAMLVQPADVEEEDPLERLPGSGSFTHYQDLKILEDNLAEEYDFMASAKGFEDPYLVDILSRWLGIGRTYRSKSFESRREAAAALSKVVLKKDGTPYSPNMLLGILTKAKQDLAALFQGKMKKDPKFAAMILQNIRLREKFENAKEYEPYEYHIDKAAKAKFGGSNPKEEFRLGDALLKHGVKADDFPRMFQVIRGVISGQYTPHELAKNTKLLPPQYIGPLSDTLDSLGVKLWRSNVGGSADKEHLVNLKEEIANANAWDKTQKEIEAKNHEAWLGKVLAWKAMNPDHTEKE